MTLSYTYGIGATSWRLEEPPEFDYDRFIDDEIPSDTRMKILFPDDVEMRTNYRDAFTESHLLHMYWSSVAGSLVATKGDPHRDKFYEGLMNELVKEMKDVQDEFYVLHSRVPRNTPQWWEYNYLDQDGGTKNLKGLVSCGWNVFAEETPEVVQAIIEKYGHLFPSEYWNTIHRRRLEYWENKYLDRDGGTTELQRRIAEGREDSIFVSSHGGIEAKHKYGYLLELPMGQLRLEMWEEEFLDHDGGITKVWKMIAKGRAEKMFDSEHWTGGEEARAKYGYLFEQVALSDYHNPANNILECIRDLFSDTSSSTAEHDNSASDILESIRNLFPDMPPHSHSTSRREESKNEIKILMLDRSRLPTSTLLALLPLVALELFLVFQAHKEWMAWYG